MTTIGKRTDQPAPLIGRLVHGSVQLAGVIGPAWFGWNAAGGGVAGAAAGVIIITAFAFLWLGVHAPADPEPNRFGIVAVNGRTRLLLEIVLIVAGGGALWLAWHRAAGETFLTVAIIDFVVRYPRVARLYRNT